MYSLGVGLTSACTFSCRHCYSGGGKNPVEIDPADLYRFLDRCPVNSVNLGTGESSLHPKFHSILEELHRRDLPVALTTAGPSVEALSDTELGLLHDVDFSLDFPSEADHDGWRAPGAFKMVTRGIERCRANGVTASVAMCLMRQNASMMESMCDLCSSLGVSLRVNVYKPINTTDYQADYLSFWRAVDTLFQRCSSAVSSEPIVNAALAQIAGEPVFSGSGSPCGKASLRLRPGGAILPCVYWNTSQVTINSYLQGEGELPCRCPSSVPEQCRECSFLDLCGGGCAGRRLYTGRHEPDIYCHIVHGNSEPPLRTVPDKLTGDDYIHASYLCTMIAEF